MFSVRNVNLFLISLEKQFKSIFLLRYWSMVNALRRQQVDFDVLIQNYEVSFHLVSVVVKSMDSSVIDIQVSKQRS
jgi:predicted transcriptional regulator